MGANKIVGMPMPTPNNYIAPWQRNTMQEIAERMGANRINKRSKGDYEYWELSINKLKDYYSGK